MKILAFAFLILFSIAGCCHAADGFIKGGIILHPTDDEVSDRWLLAFGVDWKVAVVAHLGLEVNSAYYLNGGVHQREGGGLGTIVTVPVNVFANAKVKSTHGGVRPFAGGGLGIISTYINGPVGSDYVSDFGYHLMAGLEVGSIEGNAFLLELQAQQTVSADDNRIRWIAFAGIRF